MQFAGARLLLITLESNSYNVTNSSTEKQQRKFLPPFSRLRTNIASLGYFVVPGLALTILPSELLCVF
jgi:hypothetical protein